MDAELESKLWYDNCQIAHKKISELESYRDKLVENAFKVVNALEETRAERDRYKKALEMLANGIDHPLGIQGAPHFYEAMHWTEGLARLALRET